MFVTFFHGDQTVQCALNDTDFARFRADFQQQIAKKERKRDSEDSVVLNLKRNRGTKNEPRKLE